MRKASIQSILNNLAGTAIYVVRQDNHQILYFNDRVAEVSPDAKIGAVCNELWAGSCDNCPLPGLKDKETYQTVNYGDPFGEVVDISASQMLWEDSIPAFLISVTPHILTKSEKQEADRKKYLAAATKRVYMLVASVNMMTGTYEIITKHPSYQKFLPEFGTYEELLKKCTDVTHPTHVDSFRRTFSRKNLMKNFMGDQEEVQLEFKQQDAKGSYHWKLMQILCMGSEGCTGEAVLLLSHIDSRKEMEREWEAFSTGVAKLFGECMILNLDDGSYTTAKYDNAMPEFPMTGDFEAISKDYCDHLIHPDDRQIFREVFSFENLRKIANTGEQVISRELRRYCPDGRYHYTEMIAIPAGYAEREYRMVVLTFRDVDKIKKEEERKREALQDALSLAEQANNAKSDFLSRMSHDIRSPMNAVIGMTTIAQANGDNPRKVADCLKKIQTSSRFLLALINDILDMSKIENGKMVICRQDFSMRALIRELADIACAHVQEKQQTLKIELAEDIEDAYCGDRLRLNQVLMNLLSNAIKYTQEKGTIVLRVSQTKMSDNKTIVHFEVEDNGIGMSKDFLEYIFEPFEQAQEKGKMVDGTGLGLSIARNLVHLMGGSIQVASEPEKGSRFTVELPFIQEVNRTQAAILEKTNLTSELRDKKSTVKGMKMLVVEDNPLNQEIAETLFEMEGFSIELAEDGAQGLKLFLESPNGYYKIILMDVQMPLMDGLEASRQIRKLNRADAKTVPIIAMTANAFSEDVAAAKKAGMNSHLAKPIDMEVAMKEIEKVLKG